MLCVIPRSALGSITPGNPDSRYLTDLFFMRNKPLRKQSNTTHGYVEPDLAIKEKALGKTASAGQKPKRLKGVMQD